MNVATSVEGTPTFTIASESLEAVGRIWHPRIIDILGLKEIGRFRARAREVEWEGREVVAKIARFDYEIRLVENETRVYKKLEKDRLKTPDLEEISPAFVGHLAEDGRVIGMLLETLEGRVACPEDLSACEAVLRRVHTLGIIHGDPNKHNFVVTEQTGKVHLIDFENAKDGTSIRVNEELNSLKDHLAKNTGTGGEGDWTGQTDIWSSIPSENIIWRDILFGFSMNLEC